MDYALTIFDAGGIQSYIFASNRLRHNLAASYLVEKAMGDWLDKAVREVCGAGVQLRNDSSAVGRRIENASDGLTAELIFRGGGNAVLVFKSDSELPALKRAQAVARALTLQVMLLAPGLRIAAAHEAFDWSTMPLNKVYEAVMRKLAQNKSRTAHPPAMLGQGVTALCSYTSLPAVKAETEDGRTRYLSAETEAKQAVREDARNALKVDFAAQMGNFDFEDDFGEFGEEDEHSYMAIVHADGNGMGSRKTALCSRFTSVAQNRPFIEALHTFSDQINAAGLEAFRDVVKKAVQRCRKVGGADEPEDGRKRILFTPIVYGGDDVTFACDGIEGLWLAAFFLKRFAAACERRELLKGAQACAGVAVVNTHFPFARAYALASELCKNAKHRVRERAGAYIDWHFAVNGAVRSISQIRSREYSVDSQKSLTLRPLAMEPPQPELRSWAVFSKAANTFLNDKEWKGRRNKVKELREMLREGDKAVEQFRSLFDLPPLPALLDLPTAYQQTGWHGNQCVYFDAIEAMDHFDGGQLE